MSDKLTVIEQKDVILYEDTVTAVRTSDGQVYVSIKHMCDALGLAQRAQVLRIQRNDILLEGYEGGIMMITPGGRQPLGALSVDPVPLWLAGVDTNRVNEEIRPKLKHFQREAAKVLWEAFQEGRLTADPLFEDLLQQDTPEVQAYKMIQSMLQLARNQILLKSRLDDHEQRLEAIESQLAAPAHTISQSQAMQLSQAVKAVAFEYGKKTKRNEHPAIYGEMYR
ncbi:MAG: hypothetical protein KF770_18105 [Anaerolineae bacterium]|nr:hypothetical protein [Anaerolineae bacterium]